MSRIKRRPIDTCGRQPPDPVRQIARWASTWWHGGGVMGLKKFIELVRTHHARRGVRCLSGRSAESPDPWEHNPRGVAAILWSSGGKLGFHRRTGGSPKALSFFRGRLFPRWLTAVTQATRLRLMAVTVPPAWRWHNPRLVGEKRYPEPSAALSGHFRTPGAMAKLAALQNRL